MVIELALPDSAQGLSVTYVSAEEGRMEITSNVFIRDELISGAVLNASDGTLSAPVLPNEFYWGGLMNGETYEAEFEEVDENRSTCAETSDT